MKLPRLLRTPPPSVALDISARHVAAVEMSGGPEAGFRVANYAIEPLAEGVVVPSLNESNLARPADLKEAIQRVWGRLGSRPKRVALVVPDALAKVSFVRFQQVPSRAADLDQLIKFQIRKSAPFRIEDSQISYRKGLETGEGQEFVVVQARRDLVGEYEAACLASGATAGVVDLATFNVANAVLAGDAGLRGDWLLVHVTPDGASLAVFRGRDLAFFRHRGSDADGNLGDVVHQTAMFYQDRLGGAGFARVLMAGGAQPDGQQSARKTIEARLGRSVEAVDPMNATAFAERTTLPGELADALAAAIGLAVSQWGADGNRSA
ncbi:MAG: pilus assembly protein PilM [Acidobacteriota bacterium]